MMTTLDIKWLNLILLFINYLNCIDFFSQRKSLKHLSMLCGPSVKYLKQLIMSQKITVLIGVNDFFGRPGSGLFISIFICLHRDLLRGCLPPFWDFPGNCTSFSGNSIEPFSSKEDSCTWEYLFLHLLQFVDKCFRSNQKTWSPFICRKFAWKNWMYWSNLKAKGYLLSRKLVNSKIPLHMSSWQKWHYILW